MKEIPIKVSMVERLGPDIIVYFSNGASAIFHAQFLFDMQAHDHNVPLRIEDKAEQSF